MRSHAHGVRYIKAYCWESSDVHTPARLRLLFGLPIGGCSRASRVSAMSQPRWRCRCLISARPLMNSAAGLPPGEAVIRQQSRCARNSIRLSFPPSAFARSAHALRSSSSPGVKMTAAYGRSDEMRFQFSSQAETGGNQKVNVVTRDFYF